jgi:hypothetical protein
MSPIVFPAEENRPVHCNPKKEMAATEKNSNRKKPAQNADLPLFDQRQLAGIAGIA